MTNWLEIGRAAAGPLISIILSVLICSWAFRKFIAPEFVQALEDATKAAQTLASLGGLKKHEWEDGKKLEKVVAADLINQAIPELQALKLIVGADTWEQIEELVQENPDQAMALYKKYGHLIPGASQTTEKYDF